MRRSRNSGARRSIVLIPAALIIGAAVVLSEPRLLDGAQRLFTGVDRDERPPAVVPGIPDDAFPVAVVRISDGDTLRAVADVPGRAVPADGDVRLRLIGIDAPEVDPAECGATEATARLSAVAPVGATLWVSLDAEPLDPYDRPLVYAWNGDGVFVNHDLVASGLAEARRHPPNTRHAAVLEAAEDAARSAGLGQWGAC